MGTIIAGVIAGCLIHAILTGIFGGIGGAVATALFRRNKGTLATTTEEPEAVKLGAGAGILIYWVVAVAVLLVVLL